MDNKCDAYQVLGLLSCKQDVVSSILTLGSLLSVAPCRPRISGRLVLPHGSNCRKFGGGYACSPDVDVHNQRCGCCDAGNLQGAVSWLVSVDGGEERRCHEGEDEHTGAGVLP
jgi:hypothetical protein